MCKALGLGLLLPCVLTLNIAGQSLVLTPVVSVDILQWAEIVGPIRLTPDTPGDEILFRTNYLNRKLIVGVVHANRSGYLGVIESPGLCLEPGGVFALPDLMLTIMDITGDGRDDVIGTRSDGQAQVLVGQAPIWCK